MIKQTYRLIMIICVISLLSSCSYLYYKSPEQGASISVTGINCSVDSYINNNQSLKNYFRIPVNTESRIKVKATFYVSNGYYYDYFYYTLEPNDYNSSAEITITYKGKGKFGSSIDVNGMAVSFN